MRLQLIYNQTHHLIFSGEVGKGTNVCTAKG